MPRKPSPWTIKKYRNYWYYKLRGEKGYHTTGIEIKNWKTTKPKAEKYAQTRAGVASSSRNCQTFKDYAFNYFLPGLCPWYAREVGRENFIKEHERNQHRGRLEIHILPHFGKLLFEELSPVAIENWLYALDYASQTKKHILRTLRIILFDMRRERLINFSPAEIKPPVVSYSKKEIPADLEASILFPENINLFKKLWGNRYNLGVFCALAYSSGMRSGELRALRWPAVKWDLSSLVVVVTIDCDEKINIPKANSARAIPIPKWTLILLETLPGAEAAKKGENTGYIFPGTKKAWISTGATSRALKAVCKKAEIETCLTPHGLRHGYNTKMRSILAETEFMPFFDNIHGFKTSTKATDDILRTFTGHKSPDMTDLYDHPELVKQLQFFDKYFRKHINSFWDFRKTDEGDK